MHRRRSAHALIAILFVLPFLAGPSLHASGNETLLQKMKRLEAERQESPASIEILAPTPVPEKPRSVFPPDEEIFEESMDLPEWEEDEKNFEPTRPARPLEWPPEPYMEDLRHDSDEESKDKDFKTLRVPLGEAAPVYNDKGRRSVTFSARRPPEPSRLMPVSAKLPSAAQDSGIQEGGTDIPSYTGYILGPGDKLKITVFGEEALSGNFTVNDAGQLSYPLIGEVMVRNMNVLQAKDKITALLREGYLRDPHIAIEVSEFRPFYITGEVRTPGSYSYVADMSVMNAVVMAGGFTFRAKQNEVEILRNTASGSEMLKDMETDAKVQPGDIILVKERFF